MNEYQIYAIKSKSYPELQYIGSTKLSLKKRLQFHKSQYKRYCKGLLKCHYSSFDVMKYDDYYIELYCETGTYNRSDAEWLEGQVIRAESCINKFVPGRTNKQYYQDNIEKIKDYRLSRVEDHKEYVKEHYQQNKEFIKAQKREKIICECGIETSRGNIQRHKKSIAHYNLINNIVPVKQTKEERKRKDKIYREANKEKIAAQSKILGAKYYEKNKEKLLNKNRQHYQNNAESVKAQKREKIICECGISTTRGNKTQHEYSDRHIEWMKKMDIAVPLKFIEMNNKLKIRDRLRKRK